MKTLILTTLFFLFPGLAIAQSSKAPQLTLKDLKGREFRLSDYKGKVVLINFWATWCPPCRMEIPDLIKKQKMYSRQGLQIVGITYPPQKTSEVRSFVNRLRLNYLIALGTKATKSMFTSSEALPLTVVIDRDGLIRDVIEGIMYEDEFDQKIKPLLSPHSP
jgi:peroxiredoxin